MNCPYCSKEMRCGYFHNSERPIQWIPDGKSQLYLTLVLQRGQLPLVKNILL